MTARATARQFRFGSPMEASQVALFRSASAIEKEDRPQQLKRVVICDRRCLKPQSRNAIAAAQNERTGRAVRACRRRFDQARKRGLARFVGGGQSFAGYPQMWNEERTGLFVGEE